MPNTTNAAPPQLSAAGPISYSVGGYVVCEGKVLLLWQRNLNRWVPSGGSIDTASGELPHEVLKRELIRECGIETINFVSLVEHQIRDHTAVQLPTPVAAQLLALPSGDSYFDLVYYVRASSFEVDLNYQEAMAYHWFTPGELLAYPLLDHVRVHGATAITSIEGAIENSDG